MRMDRKQLWILINILNICVVSGVAPDYLSYKVFNDASGCTININGDLPDVQPLLIRPGTAAFVYPEDRNGIIHLEDGQEIEIYCSSGFNLPVANANLLNVKCVEGNFFEARGIAYEFKDFSCNEIPTHVARKTGSKCFNDNGEQVEVGFDVGFDRFLKVFEVCHDEVTETNYYAKYRLTPANEGFQRSYPRPRFITGSFFNGKNVDALYSRAIQRETIAGLIGSFPLAQTYVEATSDVYMSRGHLAAKADFIYGSQHEATFYFINTAPQWQRFNGLNWEAVEDGSRKLAANRNITLDVYTGTHGVTTLKDVNENPRDIHLYVNGRDRRIPVPMLYYKVLLNRRDNEGIVLIGVNNPHLTLDEIMSDYVICTDISDSINYINWQNKDISRGYSYACDVNEFLNVVPHFSEMFVRNILI